MAIQAAAEAAASAETTSVVSDAGSVTNSVTGDTGTFVLGKTIAGGSEEVGQVAPGTPVPELRCGLRAGRHPHRHSRRS